MKISLKAKMGFVLAFLIILTVTVLSVLVLKGIETNQRDQLESELIQKSKAAEQTIRQSYLTGDPSLNINSFLQQKGQRLASSIASQSGMQTVLYNQKGQEAGSSIPIGQKSVDVSDTLSYALKGKIAYQNSGSSLIYFAPVSINHQLIGAVRFEHSLKNNQQFIADIRHLFRAWGTIAAASAFLIGYAYFYRIASLIASLQKTSQQIRKGRYLTDLPFKRGDELGELSQGLFFMSTSIEKNIDQMKEEKRKLELAISKLQSLEQQQKQFIGNISHEFKTPLTSIKAYVDLLDMYRDDPQLMEDGVQNIRKETDRLHEMVDKILKLSALEKYDFEQRPESVKLKGLLEDICDRMKGKAAKFDLTLHTNINESVVWADRESLIHIFINLIDNAIKYNEPGGKVEVTSYTLENSIIVDVANTGIGIPPEAEEKLFQPFFTVNKDRSRLSGGTGLGLALAKDLTEKQKGIIRLHHSDSKWTIFKVSFPLKTEK
ncbi:sensor histidine kinase [Priestia megaterium]|uniref:sensor histidine kinase n=1 Tax=Priestia megaterium TaxID=1404 RepID=UPI0021F41872|nr:HAMP domain-containing sensor histidine kinase [Priestia megaterium]UYP10242.1 HAMP domain-containing histidine kinase [Priestia megaterium]